MAAWLWLLAAMLPAALPAVRAAAPARPVAGGAAGPPVDEAFFEKRIRPLLHRQCGACHGADKQAGQLRVDSREALLKGGARGPSLVPGEVAASLLVAAVRRVEGPLAAPKMPPGGRLPDRDIADLERWVAAGAPWPAARAGAPAEARHWAFQPVRDPQPPPVQNRAWPRTGVDRFVLAALEARGLRPAPPADRATLLRRATYDLTGLPPTPEELRAFLEDRSPGAWERVIERLLASPHYGERWGRHWLDVARYADSNGLDENVAHGNAWRYRDYVVASLNADKPFDRFLQEQVAGDLLPAATPERRREQLIATGFLALGPKVLAEPDKVKLEMDLVDEQVDTLGRAALGLTLGCARCHDHKFDPISIQDYYALAGIFKSTRTMETLTTVARWWENPLVPEEERLRLEARAKEHAEQVKAARVEVDRVAAAERRRLRAAGQAVAEGDEEGFAPAVREELARRRAEVAALEAAAPEVPTAMGVTEGSPADLRVHLRGDPLTLGEPAPRGVPAVLAASAAGTPAIYAGGSGRLELARWLTRPSHPLTPRVLANRIWRWHFGAGLVATPDNFGRLGEPPSHPELLDWLARRLVEHGWSLKAMHRLLMRSATYQLSGAPDARAAAVDPENRLLWRFAPRRLEAEELRDGLLAVSGLLDRTAGGSLLQVKNRQFFFDHTSRDLTRYDSRRRSLYLPVVRNNLYDVFQLFDFADPAVAEGNRATTTVAPQALFWLNSDLVHEAAAALTRRAHGEAGTAGPEGEKAAVRRAYLLAYGRPATPEEVRRALGLLERLERVPAPQGPAGLGSAPPRERAWTWFCHALLAANEFSYVR